MDNGKVGDGKDERTMTRKRRERERIRPVATADREASGQQPQERNGTVERILRYREQLFGQDKRKGKKGSVYNKQAADNAHPFLIGHSSPLECRPKKLG